MGAAPGLKILIGTAAAFIVLAGLREVSSIAGPVFLALTLMIAVSPLRSWLVRRGAPVWVTVAVPLGAVLLTLLALLFALILALAQLATLVPSYSHQLNSLAQAVTGYAAKLGIKNEQIQKAVTTFDPTKILELVQGFLSGLLSVSTAFVLIVVLLVSMSLDTGALVRRLVRIAPGRPDLVQALANYARGTCRYLVVSSVFGLIVAVLDTGLLAVLGVPLPMLWGLLAFITNYIPNLGFVIGLVPPALLGLLQSGWVTMLLVVVGYCVINFVIQSLIQPKFLGQAVGLSVTLTMLSLLVWAYVLGALGAVLAVPLTAFVKAVLVDSDPRLRWAGDLMADSGMERRAA
ncbi:AI-2E family transporter [Rhizohabitans arisaemae]|uniref:AI-2E family transporter n=1 Tax=Rhizohabitans arisaemae TaxID=2720610 RepID=UPI0024B04341|nr:AI-2E family transporter [Rhizohabitans arisaemae]